MSPPSPVITSGEQNNPWHFHLNSSPVAAAPLPALLFKEKNDLRLFLTVPTCPYLCPRRLVKRYQWRTRNCAQTCTCSAHSIVFIDAQENAVELTLFGVLMF